MTSVKIRVLFFGPLREAVARAEEVVSVPGPATVEAIFGECSKRFPVLNQYRSSTLVARNQDFVPFTSQVQEGDEVAFLPPVSGG